MKKIISKKTPPLYMSRIPKKWSLIKNDFINTYEILQNDASLLQLSDPNLMTTSIAKKTNRSQNDVCMEILNWELRSIK
ncbi:hypothetical protein J8281_12060 [Aquimarina sp. U1-2]|uniref:hypothetical protein n=1 Tax=Aquimarina sp. U1-2 TaxID=2823141 RepID=UPI001AECB0EF|nr:hypothetical protein [Aquimarina sp. U1-2]MBP2832921.1 hypothetical protein [Aquimarina sp. U1-2]